MEQALKFLLSTRAMAIFFVVYIIAMACGTFIESAYETPAAKAWVYNAKWFEILQLLLIINFIANIKQYRLWRREKWSLLLFHLGFVVVFVGAAVTRYISFEGMMLIREGEASNEIYSDLSYFKLQVNDNEKLLAYQPKQYWLSKISHDFKARYQFKDKEIEVEFLEFIPHAKDSIMRTEDGKKILQLVSMGQEGRQTYHIMEGETKNVNGLIISYNNPIEGSVQITEQNDSLWLTSPLPGNYVSMAGQNVGSIRDSALLAKNSGSLTPQTSAPLKLRTLYTIDQRAFVVPNPSFKGKQVYLEGDKILDKDKAGVIKMQITVGNESQVVYFKGDKGVREMGGTQSINGLQVTYGFGSIIENTNFSIRLNDFQLDRYPGSDNPSSFASEITVMDNGKEMDKRIFMNNVLDYKGYRFYQSGYDQDELGTQLSVNQDWWGTNITYLGYFMLFIGFFFSLFWKGTRFVKLNSTLKKMGQKGLAFVLFSMASLGFAQIPELPQKQIHIDSLVAATKIPKEHLQKINRLQIQDFQGRIKPLGTHALELVRKIHQSDDFFGMDPTVWFLDIQFRPSTYFNTPLIKVGSGGGNRLLEESGANDEGYTSVVNLIAVDERQIHYKFDEEYNKTFAKKPADRSKRDNELIKLTERFNIVDNVAKGYQFVLYPIPNDPNNQWNSWVNPPVEIDSTGLELTNAYFTAYRKAKESGDWAAADTAVDKIAQYQKKWGANVLKSDFEIDLELFYNKARIFFWAMIAYSILGLILVVIGFVDVFSPKNWLQHLGKLILFLVVLVGFAQALGLAARWYISGHAPWSNGYEAIVFISWVAVLVGLFLFRNRNHFIPATGCLVAAIMMGFAHGGSLLDPQITPLVPVLKSYWLMIHVAIITSSYAFFGVGAILSIIALVLMSLTPNERLKTKLKEITITNEMALTIGIFVLTTGTFLGGMWANESWGRYWSWDPKETWAFISVIVYAFVLHMRLVPGLRSPWTFNFAAMWAIWSIIMTYFGVNYYLSGLHSYAAGDPVPIPTWIYFTVAGMALLSIISYIRNRGRKLEKAIKE